MDDMELIVDAIEIEIHPSVLVAELLATKEK